MENFEAKLAEATAAGENGGLLGAIGIVVNGEGQTLYHHASGRQTVSPTSPPLDPDSTVVLGSAGKFVTHLAALQLVERGLVGLDEPVYAHLPELAGLPIIASTPAGEGVAGTSFSLAPAAGAITLRHLLLHASGLADPDHALVAAWNAADSVAKPDLGPDAPLIARMFAMPLLFEPGQGYQYGCSVHWVWLLVTRLATPRGDYHAHVKREVFDALGMATSTYKPAERKDVWERRLQLVDRREDKDGGGWEVDDGAAHGLTLSVTDMGRLMADLVAARPTLLREKEHVDLLFRGQFAPASPALAGLLGDVDNWRFIAGKPAEEDGSGGGGGGGEKRYGSPRLNWSAAGLVVEEEDVLPNPRGAGLPKGTVAWEGMPNVLWAMNRERGVGAFFATQLTPFGDEVANGLATGFMRDVWKTFG